MSSGSSRNRVRAFFAGTAEHTFQVRLGVADPPLIDYLSSMLAQFVRRDELYKVRSPNGRTLDQVVDMMVEAEARRGPAKRRVHLHIGYFTLFFVGFFPEAVERLKRRGEKDGLIDYPSQGKRAYRIASAIPTNRGDAPHGDVLERLSEEFELCAYGLGEIRRQWEEGKPGETLLWPNTG